MQPKFKQGDKVRYIGETDQYIEVELTNRSDRILEIVADRNDGYQEVKFEETTVFDDEDLELVERPDPTTAFLTELQNLLRRYDARIFASETFDMSYKKLGNVVGFYIGDDIEVFPTTFNTITPDNIFDYEK